MPSKTAEAKNNAASTTGIDTIAAERMRIENGHLAAQNKKLKDNLEKSRGEELA